jgi:TetR/AcrR family fatty acid metabolism transcriptional regulator
MGEFGQGQAMSRRDRLKQEREERILDAAATVFARKGFHKATIREISDLADVADGTIYNYFDNKFDLLIGLFARLAELDRLPGELGQDAATDARSFMFAAFQHRMDRIRQNEEMLRAVLPEVLVNSDLRERFYRQYVLRIASILEPYVRRQVERGQMRPVDVPLTVRVVQSMFVGILLLRILGDEPLCTRWEEMPETFVNLIFDGLGPPDGGGG